MIILFLIAIAASLYHSLDEIRDVKSKLEAMNKTFSLKEHVQRNYLSWIVTLCGILVMVLLHYHFYADIPTAIGFRIFTAGLYLTGGYGGASFFTKIFSTSQERVTEVLNNKVNSIDSK